MSKKVFTITFSALLVIIAALVWLGFFVNWDQKPDREFEMVNQNITWRGAGFNGYWGKGEE